MEKEEAEIQFSEILLSHLTAKERKDVVYIHFANGVLTEREKKSEGFVYELEPNNLLFYGEMNFSGWGPRKIKNFIPEFVLNEFPKLWKNFNML